MDTHLPGGLPSTVAGYRLRTELRSTAAGTWFLATRGDGGPVGVLLVDPAVDLGVLVASTQQLQALALPGVLTIRDLVELAGRVWLLADDPPGPTVADLTDSPIDRGTDGAARLAAELGDTLHKWHRVGLVHGRLEPTSVVVGPTGTALLADWGTTNTGTVAGDDQAWAELVWLLARQWCTDDVRGGAAVTRAAGAAMTGGLVDGLDDLYRFLNGRPTTDHLATAARGWLATATSAHPPAAEPAQRVPPAAPPQPGTPAEPVPNPAATLLGARRAAAERRLGAGLSGPAKAPAPSQTVAPDATQLTGTMPAPGAVPHPGALPASAAAYMGGLISYGPGWGASPQPDWSRPVPSPQIRRSGGGLLRAYLKVMVGLVVMGAILTGFLIFAR